MFTRNCALSEPAGMVTVAARAMLSVSVFKLTGIAAAASPDTVATHKELPPGLTLLGEQARLVREADGVGFGSTAAAVRAICAVRVVPFSPTVIVAV